MGSNCSKNILGSKIQKYSLLQTPGNSAPSNDMFLCSVLIFNSEGKQRKFKTLQDSGWYSSSLSPFLSTVSLAMGASSNPDVGKDFCLSYPPSPLEVLHYLQFQHHSYTKNIKNRYF